MALQPIEYNASYFNDGGDIGGYTKYDELNYRYTDTRTNQLITKAQTYGWDLVNAKVLVVGCAYGYLVKHLVSLGVDAYGMDISPYAISQAPQADRVFVGDAKSEASFDEAKTLAGLTKNNDKFDLIVDEDMICCLTDAEAITFCDLGTSYSNMFYHLVDPTPHLIQWYNWKTIADWKALIGTNPKEKWYSRFTWEE